MCWKLGSENLESGEEVIALVRDPAKLNKLETIMTKEMISKIEVVEGDLTEDEAVEMGIIGKKADYVIHLAAMQLLLCKADLILGAKVMWKERSASLKL